MSNYNDNSWSDKFSWNHHGHSDGFWSLSSPIGLLCALFIQPKEDGPRSGAKKTAPSSAKQRNTAYR